MPTLRVMIAGLIAGIAAITSTGATAEVTAAQPDTIIAALQSAGYQAKLSKDNDGDPLIESRAAGYRFRIVFFGCKNGAGCTHLGFSAGFATKNKPTLEQINQWNFDKAMTKAAVDKAGDPFVRVGLWLEQPVSDEYMRSFLELWDSSLGEFAKRFAH